jgi:hypothetical protein
MTLLDRAQLAKNIRSFKLSDDQAVATADQKYFDAVDELADDLWKYGPLIEATIGTIPLARATSSHIYGSIFGRCGTNYQPRPSIDGALALLLAMATNIESIQLAVSAPDYLDITQEVLSGPWNVDNTGSAFGPVPFFGKLKSVHFCGSNVTDPGMPLSIRGVTPEFILRNIPIVAVGGPAGSIETLRSLELRDVSILPGMLESLIKMSHPRNLRTLVLTNLKDTLIWSRHDYASLSQALIEHTPELEALEVSHMQYRSIQFGRPLASLKSLTRLHTLRVDLQILIDCLRDNEPLNVQGMLPKSLKHLEILMGCDRFVDLLLEDGVSGRGARMLFTDAVPSVALETFKLRVQMDAVTPGMKRFRSRTIKQLQAVIDKHSQKGLDYRIYGWRQGDEEQSKYLLGPGYEASRPYYAV